VNKGALKLKQFVPPRSGATERPSGQTRMALELGIDQAHLSRILSGKVKPSSPMRARIEERYGVYWKLFDEEAS
jgi:transcriptional regulator with XRE-family HTH domain